MIGKTLTVFDCEGVRVKDGKEFKAKVLDKVFVNGFGGSITNYLAKRENTDEIVLVNPKDIKAVSK